MKKIDLIVQKACGNDLPSIDLVIRIFGYQHRRFYDKDKARKFWEKLKILAKTDPDAMYLLGTKLLYGSPYGTSPPRGIALIELAAKKSNHRAIQNVASWYFFGQCGYPMDRVKAIELLENSGTEEAIGTLKLYKEYMEYTK